MRGHPSPLFGLIAWLLVSSAFAQFPDENLQPWPPPGESPPVINPPQPVVPPPTFDQSPDFDQSPVVVPSSAVGPSLAVVSPSGINPSPAESVPLASDFEGLTPDLTLELEPDLAPDVELCDSHPLPDFLGYRYETSSTEWIFGSDDRFGMFSLKSDHYQPPGAKQGLGFGLEFHFLDGPVRTDMPPRLYDFSVAYQHREQLGPFAFDVAASVMASSDFEGSSREGIRFPAHAVGFLMFRPAWQLVFGVDYLDRGDVKILPVVGVILLPRDGIRLEAVFPRPRVVFQLPKQRQFYISGELGGGSWAVERTTMEDDLATYRDLRVCVGLATDGEGNRYSGIEIGYLFGRRLEYASGEGDYDLAGTAMIRLTSTF